MVLLAFFGFFNVYSLRVNLSVAIVAMTENRTVVDGDGNISYEQDFPWDSKQKGLILSSFFYGYILTQFLGGYIGTRIGGNIVSNALRINYKYKIAVKNSIFISKNNLLKVPGQLLVVAIINNYCF